MLAVGILWGSCESYGPFHPNTAAEPLNSIRGPSDGRYKFAFIEFGDQGSALDTSQRAAAINAIRQAQRPLLFVYIHGWMNNANSGDVCRFEHFIDMVSRLPEVTQGKINVIGVYIGVARQRPYRARLGFADVLEPQVDGRFGGGAKQLPGYY